MNTDVKNTMARKKVSGFTVIEMFIALAVLAILVAVALPSMENVAAKADMKAATDQVAQAFRTAKEAARLTNSSVTVTLSTSGSANTVRFAFANGTVDAAGTAFANNEGNAQRRMALPVIKLPVNVAVDADTSVFTYNPMGMVNATGTIALASTTDDKYSSTVAINTLMGHVVTQYDAIGS